MTVLQVRKMADSSSQEIIRTKIGTLTKKCAFVFVVFFCYLLLGSLIFKLLEHESREDFVEEAEEDIEENRAELLKVGFQRGWPNCRPKSPVFL